MTVRAQALVLLAMAAVTWPLVASASMAQGCCTHQGQSVECPAGLPPGSGRVQFVQGGTQWAVPGKGTVFVPQTTFGACTSKPPATSAPTAPTTTPTTPSKPSTPTTTTPSAPSTTTPAQPTPQPATPTSNAPSTSAPAGSDSGTTTPSTPRRPVPPVIGPQETDLQARPLNEPDTSGGTVPTKPPGGDAKAVEQSMERVKKLREEQDKTHASIAPAKACGPDVTDYVMAVMQMIQDAYNNSWNAAERSRRCGTLYGLGFNAAWDLQGFTPSDGEKYMPQIFFQRAAPNACAIPRDPCGATVVFLGYCVNAQVVNYVQWGVMNELCDTQERGIAAQAVRSAFNSNSTGQSIMRELGGDFVRTKGDLGFKKDILKRVMDRRIREEENDWYGMDGTDCPLVCDQSLAAPWLENFSWGFQWGPEDVPITARGSDLKKP